METTQKTEIEIQVDRLLEFAKRIVQVGNSIWKSHYGWKDIIGGIRVYSATDSGHNVVAIKAEPFNGGIQVAFHDRPVVEITADIISTEKIKSIIDKHEQLLNEFEVTQLGEMKIKAAKELERRKVLLRNQLAELEK